MSQASVNDKEENPVVFNAQSNMTVISGRLRGQKTD